MLRIWLRELSSHNSGFGFDKEFEIDGNTSASDILEELFEHTREQLEDINEDMSYYNLEEYMITEWEWEDTEYFKISEWENLNNLVERVEELSELDSSEEMIVAAYMENGSDFEYAIEHKDSGLVYLEATKMIDIAYEAVDNGAYGSISNEISNYIDYEAIARDMDLNGNYVQLEDCIVQLYS